MHVIWCCTSASDTVCVYVWRRRYTCTAGYLCVVMESHAAHRAVADVWDETSGLNNTRRNTHWLEDPFSFCQIRNPYTPTHTHKSAIHHSICNPESCLCVDSYRACHTDPINPIISWVKTVWCEPTLCTFIFLNSSTSLPNALTSHLCLMTYVLPPS